MTRVVVVRERPTLRPLDRHLVETVAVEDLPRDLCAGHAAHHLDLRLLCNRLPQPALDDEAQDQRRDQEYEIEAEAFHAGSVATPFPAYGWPRERSRVRRAGVARPRCSATSCRSRRDAFVVPPWPGGRYPEWAYFAGNSLGLMPRSAQQRLEAELDGWGRLAVEAWFDGEAPWLERAGSTRVVDRPARRRARGRGRGHEHAHRQPPPAAGVVLPARARPFPDPDRGRSLPVRLARGAEPGGAARSRPGGGRRSSRAETGRGHAAHRGRRRGDRARGRPSGARAARRRQLPHRRAARRARDHDRHARRRCGERLGSRARDRQRARRSCTTQAPTSRSGATTSTSTPGRARQAAPSSTHGMRRTRPGSGSQAGGASIRPTGFGWSRTSWPAAGAEGWAVSTPPILALPPLEASLALFDEVGLDRPQGAVGAPDRVPGDAARRGRGAAADDGHDAA